MPHSKDSNIDAESATLSIGDVSKATGIPVETLRTWERRYGFPRPERTGSGHRKYRLSVVAHLELVQLALDRGMRAAQVIGESTETLRALLDLTQPEPGAAPIVVDAAPSCVEQPALEASIKSAIEGWMQAVITLDEATLQHAFERAWFTRGAMSFLHDLVAPFLTEIGIAWYEGRIAVIHEQFASAQLRTFLATHWRAFSARAQGPQIICATLPGEYHAVGLHMIAVVMAMAGCQILFLGCDSPLSTIAQAATQPDVKAALISVSSAANVSRVKQQLSELRAQLPEGFPVVIGGAGAPSDVQDALHLSDLLSLHAWAVQHCPLHASYNR